MKKNFAFIFLAFGLMVFLVSTSGFAQDEAKKICPKKAGCSAACFEKMDTDKDGQVSETEFMAKCKNRFSSMDADKSGALSKEELKPCCMMKTKTMGCPFKKGKTKE